MLPSSELQSAPLPRTSWAHILYLNRRIRELVPEAFTDSPTSLHFQHHQKVEASTYFRFGRIRI